MPSRSLEEITTSINDKLAEDFGDAARLRYVDFDSADLADYPEVHKLVEKGAVRPGIIIIEDQMYSFYIIPYPTMVREFERLGAQRVSRAS